MQQHSNIKSTGSGIAAASYDRHMTLSIIIPCYNEENYIGKCLEAIMKSSVLPDEVVVVNDGSTDESLKVIKSLEPRFKEKSVKLVVLEHEKAGIYAARKFGYDNATSDYILRIDADTHISPNLIGQVLNCLATSLAVSILPGFYETKLPSFNRFYLKLFYFELHKLARFGKPVLFGSCMAFRRDIWPEVSRQEELILKNHDNNQIWEDLLFSSALLIQDPKPAVVQPPLHPKPYTLSPLSDELTLISLRSANDSFAGVWRYMSRWPKTLWLVKSYSGIFLMILSFPFLLLSAPVVMWSAKQTKL
jgi:glycosyltransferase involved in cell wall biosynthesis